MENKKADLYKQLFASDNADQIEKYRKAVGYCSALLLLKNREEKRIIQRYKNIGDCFGACVYIHMMNLYNIKDTACPLRNKKCACNTDKWIEYISKFNDERR